MQSDEKIRKNWLRYLFAVTFGRFALEAVYLAWLAGEYNLVVDGPLEPVLALFISFFVSAFFCRVPYHCAYQKGGIWWLTCEIVGAALACLFLLLSFLWLSLALLLLMWGGETGMEVLLWPLALVYLFLEGNYCICSFRFRRVLVRQRKAYIPRPSARRFELA